jgi:hypothetical protein
LQKSGILGIEWWKLIVAGVIVSIVLILLKFALGKESPEKDYSTIFK